MIINLACTSLLYITSLNNCSSFPLNKLKYIPTKNLKHARVTQNSETYKVFHLF